MKDVTVVTVVTDFKDTTGEVKYEVEISRSADVKVREEDIYIKGYPNLEQLMSFIGKENHIER